MVDDYHQGSDEKRVFKIFSPDCIRSLNTEKDYDWEFSERPMENNRFRRFESSSGIPTVIFAVGRFENFRRKYEIVKDISVGRSKMLPSHSMTIICLQVSEKTQGMCSPLQSSSCCVVCASQTYPIFPSSYALWKQDHQIFLLFCTTVAITLEISLQCRTLENKCSRWSISIFNVKVNKFKVNKPRFSQ